MNAHGSGQNHPLGLKTAQYREGKFTLWQSPSAIGTAVSGGAGILLRLPFLFLSGSGDPAVERDRP